MSEAVRTVGRYEVLDRIGSGAMATVELARQMDLDRLVALKQLKVLDDSDPTAAQRFLRESRLAGSLSHPNIVTVYDYFEHEGTPYIAMEHVPGGSLRPHIGRLTIAQSVGVLEAVLAGLAHAERNGVVHRDLKPENLMITHEGRIKIADFGLAKATTQIGGGFRTRTGITVGTPAYIAPEQAMSQEVGPWTDLYSVGCMAFELFSGRVPFHDTREPMAIVLHHINDPVPALTTVMPGFDPRLSSWTERLLAKDPNRRTRSAAAAWDELEEIVLSLVGPRWRREAQLPPAPQEPAATPPPAPVADQQPVAPPEPPPAPAPAPPPPPEPEPESEAPDAGYETYIEMPAPRPPTRTQELQWLTDRQVEQATSPSPDPDPSPAPVADPTERYETLEPDGLVSRMPGGRNGLIAAGVALALVLVLLLLVAL